MNWLVVFARTNAVGFGVSPWRCMVFSGGAHFFLGGGGESRVQKTPSSGQYGPK